MTSIVMGDFKFKRTKSRRRMWKCPKDVKLHVENPGKAIISKTRKKTRKTRQKLMAMDSTRKREILERQGVLKQDSKAPSELVNLMITNLL
mgnify:FL=1|tara:strand:- start:341 stop:613 length:273 start_codon:yes stop_codon:yes gene_type:complete